MIAFFNDYGGGTQRTVLLANKGNNAIRYKKLMHFFIYYLEKSIVG
jgi:hypothetical protein